MKEVFIYLVLRWSFVINVAFLLVTFSTTTNEDTINPAYQMVSLMSEQL